MKCLLFIVCLVPSLLWAQKGNLDTLWSAWQNDANNDVDRLTAIHKYIKIGYLKSKPDSAFILAGLERDFAVKVGNKRWTAGAINLQGTALNRLGKKREAISYSFQALNVSVELKDKRMQGALLNNIATAYKNIGQTDSSNIFFDKSLTIRRELNDSTGIASTLNNAGNLFKDMGEFKRALQYLDESLQIYNTLSNKRGISKVNNNLGTVYKSMGQYPKAVECYNKSLEMALETKDSWQEAGAYQNLGSVFWLQKYFDKALYYYVKGKDIFYSIKDYNNYATSLANIGNVHYEAKALDSARFYHNQALTIRLELNDQMGIAFSYNALGSIDKLEEKFSLALGFYKKSLLIRKQQNSGHNLSWAHWNLSDTYYSMGDFQLAKAHADTALEIAAKIGARLETQNAIRALFKIYWKTNMTTQANKYAHQLYNSRIEDIKLNFPLLSEFQKYQYLRVINYDFTLILDYGINDSRYYNKEIYNLCYNILLLRKELTLKSSINVRTAILNSSNDSLISKYEEWLEMKTRIANGDNSATLISNSRELESELTSESKMFQQSMTWDNVDWKAIRSILKNNEYAIEFVRYNKTHKHSIYAVDDIHYAALLINRKSNTPTVIPLCSENELISILDESKENRVDYLNNLYQNEELYKLVWAPIQPHLRQGARIFISKEGILHKIAFDAVSNSSTEPLMKRYSLYNVGSTASIKNDQSNNKIKANDSFTFFGGIEYGENDTLEYNIWTSLPGTLSEVTSAKELLTNDKFDARIFKDQKASDSAFIYCVKTNSVIHLATHGFFLLPQEEIKNNIMSHSELVSDINFRASGTMSGSKFNTDAPMKRSGVIFADANIKQYNNDHYLDGVLTAEEISLLDLSHVKLTVLSACETGLGDISATQGVYGLQRAFRLAGVKSLVMSLWQVPDKETAEFMTHFYRALTKKKDIPKSFSIAQSKMAKIYPPYYWAAFILME